MAQYGDLPQIMSMDESHYTGWGAEHYNYGTSYRQQDMHFSLEDGTYFDDFENGAIGVRPLDRFMHDQYSIAQSVLYAKNTFERLPVNRFDQWPSADCYRNVSPDRTSASSGNTSQQNELHSPLTFRGDPYGSPTEAFSQPVLPYPTNSKDCDYLPALPHLGGSVTLRQLEYEHHELESEPAMEDIETIDTKHEVVSEHVPVKMDTTTSDDSREYADSGIGNSPRDAEEVVPMDDVHEDPASDSDCDYTPRSNKSGKRRRSSASSGSPNRNAKRASVSKPANTNKVTKQRARRVSCASKKHMETDDDRRPFPCPLTAYGCNSTFASKNEWKRHVNTQHIKLGFWRCDICPPTTDPNDDQAVYYNDFNRKDLFTQHLRRMHAASKDHNHARAQKEFPVNEDNLPKHQSRCLRKLRNPPQQSVCLFCDKTFEGPSSWEERMEHISRHLEKDKSNTVDMLDVKLWNRDESLERYLLDEGLVVREHGGWKIGLGKPRRSGARDSGAEESEE